MTKSKASVYVRDFFIDGIKVENTHAMVTTADYFDGYDWTAF